MSTAPTSLSEGKLNAAPGKVLRNRESTMDMATRIVGPAVGGALIASFIELGAPVLVAGAVAGAALGLLKAYEDHKHQR